MCVAHLAFYSGARFGRLRFVPMTETDQLMDVICFVECWSRARPVCSSRSARGRSNGIHEEDEGLARSPPPKGGNTTVLAGVDNQVGPRTCKVGVCMPITQLSTAWTFPNSTYQGVHGKWRRSLHGCRQRAGRSSSIDRQTCQRDVRRSEFAVWCTGCSFPHPRAPAQLRGRCRTGSEELSICCATCNESATEGSAENASVKSDVYGNDSNTAPYGHDLFSLPTSVAEVFPAPELVKEGDSAYLLAFKRKCSGPKKSFEVLCSEELARVDVDLALQMPSEYRRFIWYDSPWIPNASTEFLMEQKNAPLDSRRSIAFWRLVGKDGTFT